MSTISILLSSGEWKELQTFYHKSCITGLKEHTYSVIYADHTLSVNLFQNHPVNHNELLFTYKCDHFKPYYYAFSSSTPYMSIRNIKNLDIEGQQWIDIPLEVDHLHGIEHIPVVITSTSLTPIPVDKFVVSNGIMMQGSSINEFYFYPYATNGVSSFYLQSRVINESSKKSRSSPIFQLTSATRYVDYLLPPLSNLNQDPYPFFTPLWSLDLKNTIDMMVTYLPSDSTVNGQLGIAFVPNLPLRNRERIEINLCGSTLIQKLSNNQRVTKVIGSTTDCTKSVIFHIQVFEEGDNVVFTVKSTEGKTIITYRDPLFEARYYTFSGSTVGGSIHLNRPIHRGYCVEYSPLYTSFSILEDLTLEKCHDLCAPYHQYYGLYQGNQCICYPSLDYIHGNRVLDTKCNIYCSGSSSSYCGGMNYITVIPTTFVSYDHPFYNYLDLFKQDQPTSSMATYESYNGHIIMHLKEGISFTSSRNNLPVLYTNVPPSFSITTKISFPSYPTKEIIGFGTFNTDGDSLLPVCLIDYSFITPSLLLGDILNTKDFEPLPKDANRHTDIWLKYSRDENGIYTCAFRYGNDGFWRIKKSNSNYKYIDGYRVGIFGVGSDSAAVDITLNSLSFSTDVEQASVIIKHNLSTEFKKQHHKIDLLFSEAFKLDQYAPFTLINCQIDSVIALTDCQYNVYITVLSPGPYEVKIPENIGLDYSDQENLPLDNTYRIRGIYVPEYISTWILPSDGNTHIYNKYYNINIIFSEPVVDININDIQITNAQIHTYKSIDDYSIQLQLSIYEQGYISIYLPSDVVHNGKGMVNLESNTLLLYSMLYCPSSQINNRFYPNTNIGDTLYSICDPGYEGYISRSCNTEGIWMNEQMYCLPLLCPFEETEGVSWPSTPVNISIEYTDHCPPHTSGSLSRKCILQGHQVQWEQINNTCEYSSLSVHTTQITFQANHYERVLIPLDYLGPVTYFTVYNINNEETTFPHGILLDLKNRALYGLALDVIPTTQYKLQLFNDISSVSISLSINITETYCSRDNILIPTGDSFSLPCPSNYSGSIRITCLPQYPPQWSSPLNTCKYPECHTDYDQINSIQWPTSSIKTFIALSCPNGATGTVSRYCLETAEWGPISGQCVRDHCPSSLFSIANYTISFNHTPAGQIMKIPCGIDGYISRSCSINGIWAINPENHCGVCTSGYYKQYYNNNHEYICLPCLQGHACPDGIENHICEDNTYSEGKASICKPCTGILVKNKYGNVGCTICKANEYVYNNKCFKTTSICPASTYNHNRWPETKATGIASLPCKGKYMHGMMTRTCQYDASTRSVSWSDENVEDCILSLEDKGGVALVYQLEYHYFPLYLYTQETHILNIRSIIHLLGPLLQGIHIWPGVEEKHENHVYTIIHVVLTVKYGDENNIQELLEKNLLLITNFLRYHDPYSFSPMFYINMHSSTPEIEKKNVYCYNKEYDQSILVGELLNTPCEDLSNSLLSTSNYIGEVITECGYEEKPQFKQSQYDGCKLKTPTIGRSFIDVVFYIENLSLHKVTCNIRHSIQRFFIRVSSVPLFDCDIHTFKSINNKEKDITQFSVRYETLSESGTSFYTTVQQSAPSLQSFLLSSFPSDIPANIHISIDTLKSNITTNSIQPRRRLFRIF
ncbi:hypothetical protein WA158_006727 [Blastocystis sp. Blastoise]